jgi:hypothetical protein
MSPCLCDWEGEQDLFANKGCARQCTGTCVLVHITDQDAKYKI